jgi:pyruvate,water dikinase
MKIDPEPTLSEVGGKAYHLYKLKQHFNIPPFFVLSFESHQEITNLSIQKAILKECEIRNFNLMAVRSSAVCEDSPKTSFAGMFKTVLCVQPSQLIDAISEVLNSVFLKRVIDYCETHGINQKAIKMAIIVQKMTNGRVSGICFTRFKKGINSLLIEANYGLGEPIVSGKVTPDSYIIDRKTLSVTKGSIGYQKIMLTIVNDNGKKLNYVEVPFYKRNARKLSFDEIKQIVDTCLKIERYLGFTAADVEWSIEKETLFILQAREFTGFDI